MANLQDHRRNGSQRSATIASNRDGVLAFAITLLVLEIKVPEAEEGQLWHNLGRLCPSYSAHAVSFLTIGIM